MRKLGLQEVNDLTESSQSDEVQKWWVNKKQTLVCSYFPKNSRFWRCGILLSLLSISFPGPYISLLAFRLKWLSLKPLGLISIHFQGKPFNMTLIQVYTPTTNAKEAKWFYEGLQDLQELTPQKDFLFITGDWNAKLGSQEISEVTGKFGLGVQSEAGQRLTELS